MLPYKTNFKSGKDVLKAVKEYSTSVSKGFKSKSSSGKTKVYVCDHEELCPFKATWYRKKGKGIRESALKEIGEGYWYLSNFVPHGSECLSSIKVSAKALSGLGAFKGAVKGVNGGAGENLLKRIVGEVHSVGELSHAKVQRARDMVRLNSDDENKKSYTWQLPEARSSYLQFSPTLLESLH